MGLLEAILFIYLFIIIIIIIYFFVVLSWEAFITDTPKFYMLCKIFV